MTDPGRKDLKYWDSQGRMLLVPCERGVIKPRQAVVGTAKPLYGWRTRRGEELLTDEEWQQVLSNVRRGLEWARYELEWD